MAGQFELLFTGSFSAVNAVTVTHNLDRLQIGVIARIGNVSRNDLIKSIVPLSTNPRNAVVVTFDSSQSGQILISDTDYVFANIPTPEAATVIDNATTGSAFSGSFTSTLVDQLQNGIFTGSFSGDGSLLTNISGGGGDAGASYLVLSTTGSLSNERAFTPSTGLSASDGGAGAGYTVTIDDSVVATISGSTFTGPVLFNQGLSGSLTQLTDGTSYLVAGAGVTLASASNGAVTISAPDVGDITGVTAGIGLSGGGTSGTVTLDIDDSVVATVSGTTFTGDISVPNLYSSGVVTASLGFSGSLTQLTDGTSYIIAGNNTTIASASNGAITVTSIPSGSNTEIQLNDNGSFGASADLTFDGTQLALTGTFNSVRHYASSAIDPTTPSPAGGDRYYNTVLNMEMRYDGSRSKWLSVDGAMMHAGRRGNTSAGSYFRGIANTNMASTRGYYALYAGTVTAFGYTRSDSSDAIFEIRANGSNIATLASSAGAGSTTTLNADFAEGEILSLRNADTGGSTSSVNNAMAWVKIQWRVS